MVDLGYLSEEQVLTILAEQELSPGELFGKIAYESEMATEPQVAQAIAEQLNMSMVDLEDVNIDPDVLLMIDGTMAETYRVVPLEFDAESNLITLAMCDPQDITIRDELHNYLGYDIEAVVATESDIEKTIAKFFNQSETIETVLAGLEQDEELMEAAKLHASDGYDLAKSTAMADSQPVRKLLNIILLSAVKEHASDIHFEPFESEFRVRIRADGVLYEYPPPPQYMAFALITRIKVMANLDIAERRLPQDGRIELTISGHPIEFRVSVLPTMFGESVVMRVLDRSVVNLDIEAVGMEDYLLNMWEEQIAKPNGIILVTGPTGSGKTTTLYATLNEINRIEDKIITTEDPVEYDIDGIVQMPIDPTIGNTFAACLRAILRQDPDKILVGEIRDVETAKIAVEAALTGHLVFSTLHTNDAPSTITRLRDMGIPPFLLTATVEAILAQRLVRRICPNCSELTQPDTDLLHQAGLSSEEALDKKFYKGQGCQECNGSGYRGRTGLFEFLVMDERLRELINANAATEEIRNAAIKRGMYQLRQSGLAKVFDGETTLEEVVQETVVDI